MRLHVYGHSWAGQLGDPDRTPEDILKQYNIPYEFRPAEENRAKAYIIDITPEQLYAICSDGEIDVMISRGPGGMMAFDTKGKCFRQR
jgi:hypothetical protein